MVHNNQIQKVNIICKLKLIQVYNISKDSGDLSSCIDEFFSDLNTTFNKSINKSGTGITNFLSDININSWSYQDLSVLYIILLEL